MVVLNSKLYVSGNYDIWWYNLSNPSKILFGDEIILNLWDEKNANLIKQINIQVDKNWLKRIRLGSTHIYKKREICKIHVQRNHHSKDFTLYFGKKTDGVYKI